jgi:hypothetical protein
MCGIDGEVYVTPRWSGGHLPLLISSTQFYRERCGNHMLNERYEEVWCSWDENDNWL